MKDRRFSLASAAMYAASYIDGGMSEVPQPNVNHGYTTGSVLRFLMWLLGNKDIGYVSAVGM